MSPKRPHTVLVLGGIRSGKSEFAESLVADAASVRYVATAAPPPADGSDPDWSARIEAHRQRRPEQWASEDIGTAPERLTAVIKEAGGNDTILVDDLGGWLTALLGHGDQASEVVDVDAAVTDLVAAIDATAARVVVVSPEVGLSLVPTTPVGRWFADAVGRANRRLATAVDAVAFVVAGRPVWLPAESTAPDDSVAVAGSPAARGSAKARTAAPDVIVEKRFARAPRPAAKPIAVPVAEADSDEGRDGSEAEIRIGMTIPVPDIAAGGNAEKRMQRLPVAGPGMGGLTPLVKFAATTQETDDPRPFASIRVIAITGTHTGDIGAGGTIPAWAHPDTADASALMQLAAATPGVSVEMFDAGIAAPIESGDVLTEAEMVAALGRGWRRANAAADRGDDLIVLAAGGPGVDAAAAAVFAAITRAEVPSILPRVYGPAGELDDAAWMTRCLAIRDAVIKLKSRPYDGPTALTALGGPTIATATGVLLGAAWRHTPVLIDGPVGAAAALAARDYAAQVRLWCLLTDIGGDPTVQFAADRLGFEGSVSVGLGLGEGANALALLPLFQSALAVAGLVDNPLDDSDADADS